MWTNPYIFTDLCINIRGWQTIAQGPNPASHLFLQMKLYQNRAMSICLYIVCLTTAGSVVTETVWLQNKNIYYLVLYIKSLPSPDLNKNHKELPSLTMQIPSKSLRSWWRRRQSLHLIIWRQISPVVAFYLVYILYKQYIFYNL